MKAQTPTVESLFRTMDYGPAPEDETLARAWLKQYEAGFGLFIGGAWRAARSGRKPIASINPARDEHLAFMSAAGKKDVDDAVKAAREAFPAWVATPGHQRARVLYAIARRIQRDSRIFAVLEALDTGKPLRETRDVDVPLAARHFSYHAGWAQILGSELPDHEALGVCAQITPWNFPLLMLAWKIAPAIACGNCVVLKPAERASLTSLYFADILNECGVPPGVVNIVTGDGETGEALADHPSVAKVAFTGSTGVGRRLRERSAGSGKRLSLELGGKSAFIVFDDADLDGAIEGLVDSIFFNQGEVCCAGSRLLVQESIAEAFVEKLKRRLASFRIGDPLDKSVDMGALIDKAHHERVSCLVDAGVAEGATLWRAPAPLPERGAFYPPILLTDIAPSNSAATEEIFGPVLSVLTFRHHAEAIALANNSRYGLSASVWCESVNRALSVAREIKAGTIWINCANQFDAACGFGGYRESGFGREGGVEGLLGYLMLKSSERSEEPAIAAPAGAQTALTSGIDRTAKLYIGGKQARPDGGVVRPVLTHDGRIAGAIGDGNRKDIRNAVEAAHAAASWANATAHNRAQILYYIAENLNARAEEFQNRLEQLTGCSEDNARLEVDATLSRLFSYGAWADKFDGAVHSPPIKGVTLALNEPIGVVGVICPDTFPLLGFVSLFAPLITLGNTCVITPSQRYPLLATDFYQVLETSDVPAGVVNIVTGDSDTLAAVLAQHDQVDALWCFRDAALAGRLQALSIGNLKRIWTNNGHALDWLSPAHGEGRAFLREAAQVKNIWLPFSE